MGNPRKIGDLIGKMPENTNVKAAKTRNAKLENNGKNLEICPRCGRRKMIKDGCYICLSCGYREC